MPRGAQARGALVLVAIEADAGLRLRDAHLVDELVRVVAVVARDVVARVRRGGPMHAIAALVACKAGRVALVRRCRALEEDGRGSLGIANVLGRLAMACLAGLAVAKGRAWIARHRMPGAQHAAHFIVVALEANRAGGT